MPTLRWRIPFTIPNRPLDSGNTFTLSNYALSFKPVNSNKSGGDLVFEMQLDAIDGIAARSFANDWIQTHLLNSYLVVFGAHLQLELDQPELLNRSEVGGLPAMGRGNISSTARVCASLAISQLEKSVQFTTLLQMHRERETIQRSLGWFRKAKETDDVVDGFVMQWIAFNALYGHFDPNKKGDIIAIKALINAHPRTDRIKEIITKQDVAIKELALKGLTDWHDRKDYSDELKSRMGNSDVRSTLNSVALCLFAVRNQIFHGGKLPGEETNFLKDCKLLLELIYRECLCGYVGLT